MKEVKLPKSGHSVPFEKPTAVAEALVPWLEENLRAWEIGEKEEIREWKQVKDESLLGGRTRHVD